MPCWECQPRSSYASEEHFLSIIVTVIAVKSEASCMLSGPSQLQVTYCHVYRAILLSKTLLLSLFFHQSRHAATK